MPHGYNPLHLTPTLASNFTGHVKAACDPDPECRDDFFKFTFDPATNRIFLERGEPKTADHFLFRIAIDPDAAKDHTFQSLTPSHILRIDVLRNPARTAKKKAANDLWNALQAGRLPKVTAADYTRLFDLPGEQAFDTMALHSGPAIHVDESGQRYVNSPELLRWFDRTGIGQRKAVKP